MYHEARGFDPCIGKVPWSRKWQPTPVFLLEIPWTEELGGLQSIRSQRVGHDWACPAHEASMGCESVKGSRGPPESSLPNSMDLYVLCMHICSVVCVCLPLNVPFEVPWITHWCRRKCRRWYQTSSSPHPLQKQDSLPKPDGFHHHFDRLSPISSYSIFSLLSLRLCLKSYIVNIYWEFNIVLGAMLPSWWRRL